MRRCDVLVVGGGPAGSTCAWALGRGGADVVVIDRARFPRGKACAGWVTPGVFDALHVTPAEYGATGARLQPFSAFETSVVGGRPTVTTFDRAVSYGIARSEFDAFLLRRLRTPVLEATPLARLEERRGAWVANDALHAGIVVGAGGHFCPVARHARRGTHGRLVLAKQLEIALRPDEDCGIAATTPQLFFSADLEGYGWCIRKGDLLNVGLGRRRASGFNAHVAAFAEFLRSRATIPERALDTRAWHGHAYTLAGAPQGVVTNGLVLVGDAAGLAVPESGEGIAPAIESGLAAAAAILDAGGRATTADLEAYAAWVRAQAPARRTLAAMRGWIPAAIGRSLLALPPVARYAVERFFLRLPREAGPANS